jgi:hypothetical protein
LSGGFNFSRFYVGVGISGGTTHVSKEFSYKLNEMWDDNLTVSIMNLNFGSFGYSFQLNRFVITPNIGIGPTLLSSKREINDSTEWLNSGILRVGLNIDYVFNNKQVDKCYFVNFKIFTSYFNYSKEINGGIVNFSIGIGFFKPKLEIGDGCSGCSNGLILF